MYIGWYIPVRGGVCPVIVKGEEGGKAVVLKLINGIVLERVVEFSDIFVLDTWEGIKVQ